MKSRFMKRMLSFILATVLLMGNVMPVMAEGSVSGNEVAETVVEETVVEESAVSEEPVSESEVNIEEESSEVSTTETTEETSSVESTTEESTEEETTEVSTEESTEEGTEESTEDSVSENEIPEDELSVSANEIIDEDVPLAGALPVSLESVTVNGITITVSGPASAFAEGTTVSAVEVEPAEVVIEAAEESEQAEVKRYKAFDINLVCNGEVVQPLNGEEITVNFEGDLLIPDTDSEEDVVVYHVDDNDEITKMEAEVATVETEDAAEVETVEMTTTHFSTYVILVTGEGGVVDVTINHYLENGTRLFVAQEKEVERGGSIKEFVKGVNDFTVKWIDVDGTRYTPEVQGDYTYTVNTGKDSLVIDVYYESVNKNDEAVPVTMIDYDDYVDYGNERGGSAYRDNSINYYKNYKSYEPLTYEEAVQFAHEDGWGRWFRWEDYQRLYDEWDARKDKGNWDSRFATKGAYMNYVVDEKNTENQTVNANDYNSNKPHQVIQGLLVNLTGDNYQDVNFKYEDPGFFTTELNQYGTKRIYDNYSLGFTRNGLEYNLKDVRRDNRVVWTELNRFFPLSSRHGDVNEYFGMRYDFTFKIGDYVGDMTYRFSGDDDLWVCLDGNVILDLGGIHQRVEGSVNVWEKLIGKANPSYEDKVAYLFGANGDDPTNANRVHTITVLYMERGGSESNCEMHFLMPNIVPSDPVTSNAPKADIELVKKDSTTKETIGGVGFTLYADAACQTIKGHEKRTDENGKVSFKDLRAGTYYLKETSYDASKYQVNETVYVVKVTANGENATAVIQNLSEKVGNAYVVYNTPISKTDLEFVKVDSKDSAITLAGAEFELTSTADETFKKTATSDENGKILFEDIDVGVYTLKETKAPEGYTLPSEETLTITVEAKDGELGYTVSGNESNIWLQYGKDGENHLLKNSKTVDITIRKDWQDKDGKPLATDEMEESVTVELFRKVGNNDLTKESVQKNIILSAENEWTVTIADLDSCGKDGVWTYFIEETDVEGFEAIYTEETEETTPDNIVLVVTNKEVVGSLKITKTVNRVDSEHGAAVFTFKITCADGSVLYRTITFEGDIDTDITKSVTVADLPVGECTVEELTALRYECKSDVSQTKTIEADKTTEFSFRNEKEYDKNYSHTDVIVNKVVFEKDASGNITKAITSQEKSSTSDVVTE
mgnify:CR=1 FL=1